MGLRHRWKQCAGKNLRQAIASLCLALTAAGCVEETRVVRIYPDGSGTIIRYRMVSHEVIEILNNTEGASHDIHIADRFNLQQEARRYGENVVLSDIVPVQTEYGEGFEAYFEFPDVNGIRLGESSRNSVIDKHFMTFFMQAGDPAELLIHWPAEKRITQAVSLIHGAAEGDDELIKSAADWPEEFRDEAMAQMKTLIGMKFATYVEVVGDIIDTNATYAQDNYIALANLSFSDAIKIEEVRAAIDRNREMRRRPDLEEMKEFLALIPGQLVESEPEIFVRFK